MVEYVKEMQEGNTMLFELSKILKSIQYDTLPELPVEKAKNIILNYLGTGLAAADSPITKAELSVWKALNSSGDCVILGHRGRASSLAAASVNALMGQTFLLEDCHEHTLSHPGVLAVPVALALGQNNNASGKKVIEAVIAAYESMGRIGSVLIEPGFPSFGLRPASTLAPFGGAAAAAIILGLDTEGICAALSIAGNVSSGVMEFVNSGTEDICIQNCFAAKNSVMAAMLAEKGVTGSPSILDGQFGLGRAMNQKNLDWSPALKEHPGHYMIDESFIKRFPGCGHVLPTAQASASLVANHHINPEDVEKVTVGVSQRGKDFPGTDNPGPYYGMISAMMSHQFMVASTLVHGEASVETIKMFSDPDIAAIAGRISVELNEDIDKAFPQKTGACLDVMMKDGKVLRDYQEDLNHMRRDEIIDRFMLNAVKYMPESRAGEIVEKTLNLESLDSINDLMVLLET